MINLYNNMGPGLNSGPLDQQSDALPIVLRGLAWHPNCLQRLSAYNISHHQFSGITAVLIQTYHMVENRVDPVSWFHYMSASLGLHCYRKNGSKELLAIRRIFSLVDMITNTKFSNCPNVFKNCVVWQ